MFLCLQIKSGIWASTGSSWVPSARVGRKILSCPFVTSKRAKRLEAVSLVSSGDPRFGLEVVKIIQQFDQRDIYLQLSVPEGMEPGFIKSHWWFAHLNRPHDKSVSPLSQCVRFFAPSHQRACTLSAGPTAGEAP